MKNLITVIALSLFVPVFGLAHNEMPQSPEKILGEADAVFVAQITAYKKKEGRCETKHSFELKVIRPIKGFYSASSPHLFNFTVFHPYKAKWFWQKDCPYVTYFVPPLARDMKVGNEVMISAKKGEGEKWEITGTYNLERLR